MIMLIVAALIQVPFVILNLITISHGFNWLGALLVCLNSFACGVCVMGLWVKSTVPQ